MMKEDISVRPLDTDTTLVSFTFTQEHSSDHPHLLAAMQATDANFVVASTSRGSWRSDWQIATPSSSSSSVFSQVRGGWLIVGFPEFDANEATLDARRWKRLKAAISSAISIEASADGMLLALPVDSSAGNLLVSNLAQLYNMSTATQGAVVCQFFQSHELCVDCIRQMINLLPSSESVGFEALMALTSGVSDASYIRADLQIETQRIADKLEIDLYISLHFAIDSKSSLLGSIQSTLSVSSINMNIDNNSTILHPPPIMLNNHTCTSLPNRYLKIEKAGLTMTTVTEIHPTTNLRLLSVVELIDISDDAAYYVKMDSFVYSVAGRTGNVLDLASLKILTTEFFDDSIVFSSENVSRINSLKSSMLVFFQIEIPENSKLNLQYQIHKRIRLRESFSHDASRGARLPLALLVLDGDKGAFAKHTFLLGSQLVSSPIPDFSMPFNVITLVSTVAAFLLGSMINVLVRKKGRGKVAASFLYSEGTCESM